MKQLIILANLMSMITTVTIAQKKQAPLLKWIIVGKLPATAGQSSALGFAGPVTGITEDKLIVAGGANFPGGMPWDGGIKKYYDEVYVYDKEGKKLKLQKKVYKLPAAVAYPACCTIPGGIIYVGGENKQGISSKTTLLKWDPVLKTIDTKSLPDLPIAVTNASATAIGSIVFVAGGETITGVSDKFYCIDINNVSAGWTILPSVPEQVSHFVMVTLVNGMHAEIYLMGGRKKNATGISDLYNTVFAFDVEKKEWKQKRSLPYAVTAGTGIAAGRGHILLFGGDRGEVFHPVELLVADSKAATEDSKRQELILQKNKLLSAHPGFSKEILSYDPQTDEWMNIGEISFPSPVTTTALKWDEVVIIPSGEIRAGVRTPLIIATNIKKICN